MDALTELLLRSRPQVGGIQNQTSSATLYLPGQNWSQPPVTPRDTLNESARSATESQLTVAAENAPLRVMYGTVRVGPQIACVLHYVGTLVVLMVWGHGEIDSFTSFTLDDKPLSAHTSSTLASEGLRREYWGGVTAVHYRGTMTQTKDEMLRVAFLIGQSPSVIYTDDLPGICYSVFTFLPGSSAGFPRINAIIKGRKVWTGAAYAWTDNPAFCLADFVTNATYGMGKTVDWPSVASVAADCDAIVGSEKKRTLNLSLEAIQAVTAWTDTLRTYASCWLVQSGQDLKFVSDKAPASYTTLTHAASQIQKIGSLKKRGVQNVPTVMQLTYTDTSVLPWRDAVAIAYAGGGTSLPGGTPRRESTVALPGITRYSQAMREAIERLNKLTLNDLSFELSVFDAQLVLDVGDCVTVTHPIGLASKNMRVMRCSGEYGRYTLSLVEYDPAVYNTSVATAPTWPDTQLPNPTGVLADPTAFTVTEELYVAKDQTILTRLRVTWTDAVDAFMIRYTITCKRTSDNVVMFSGYADSSLFVSPSVVEGVGLTITLYAERTSTGTRSAGASMTITPVGKTAPPANVTGVALRTSALGAEFYWTPNTELDLAGYEYQIAPYGTTSWGAYPVYAAKVASTFINISVIGTTTGGPGTAFLVRAIDTSGNRSAAAAAINYQILAPLVATVTASNIVDNNVLISWDDCERGYPINRYEVLVYKAGVYQRTMYTTSRSIQCSETSGASTQYQYRVLAYDATMLLYDDVWSTNVTGYITLTAPVKAALTASKTVETDASNNLVSVAIVGSGSYVKATSPTITSPALVTPALGTPASGNLANCTFPTLNQNTTGSSGSCTGSAAQLGGYARRVDLTDYTSWNGAAVGPVGWYNFAGGPGASNFHYGWRTAMADTNYGAEIAFNYNSDNVYFRRYNAAYGAWKEFVHTGNAAAMASTYGASSGYAVTGALTATGNITAYYSDDRLKTRLGSVLDALDKVDSLDTFYYEANELAQSLGYEAHRELGLSAQQVQAILPEVVAPAPIDAQYLTLHYERLVVLSLAAIKELRAEVNALKAAK